MSPRWADLVSRYVISRPWPIVAFQPIIGLFIMAASIRLTFTDIPPVKFDGFIGGNFYHLWLILGIASPTTAFMAWLMSHKPGRCRYLSMWFRLAADIGFLTVLGAWHLAAVFHDASLNETEGTVYARYIQGSLVLFFIVLVIRDVWSLVITERLANQIQRGRRFFDE